MSKVVHQLVKLMRFCNKGYLFNKKKMLELITLMFL